VNSTIPDIPGVPVPLVAGTNDTGSLPPTRNLAPIVGGAALLAACGLVAAFRQQAWEYPVLRVLNAAAGRSVLLDRAVHALTTRDLLEGVVFVALLWFLWFRTTDTDVRAHLLIGTTAASLAGISSRLLQIGLPTHLRPLHTPALGFVPPIGVEPDVLNHFNSFPSDHGAIYFGLALVIYRIHSPLGIAAFAWAMIVNVARVYDGYHFPSDVLGSVGLGVLVVSLFENRRCLQVARRVLVFEQTQRPAFYALAFVITYQVASLFDDVRQIGRGFTSVLLHHDPFGGS
jgi:membrane-associated phospholipid phosphatase